MSSAKGTRGSSFIRSSKRVASGRRSVREENSREREILDILEILELLDCWWINLRASLPEISFVFATLIDLKFTDIITLEFITMNIHLFLIFNFLRVIELSNIYPDIKGK